jgi:hypothetical protein
LTLNGSEIQQTISKHFMFVYEKVSSGTRTEVELFINPEEFTQVEPARITVTQTKGGAFVDYFGQGIKTISLRGVTGFKGRKIGNEELSGQEQFLNLRSVIRDWTKNSQTDPSNHILKFFNFADSEFYEIVVTNFQLMRTSGRPLLYQYNIAITCIRECGTKSAAQYKEQEAEWAGVLGDSDERTKNITTATEDELTSVSEQSEPIELGQQQYNEYVNDNESTGKVQILTRGEDSWQWAAGD